MSAELSTPLLTDLIPEDHALLARYFSSNEDLTKLAAEPGRPDFLALLRWLSRPEIAAYIAAYRTHQNQLHRQAVIDALRSVLSSPTDQIELRRAATTLLRALSQGGTPLRGVSSPSSPTSGGGGGGRPAAGAGSVPTSSAHPPHTRSARSRHAPLSSSLPPLAPSPLHPSTPSSPPLPPAPAPVQSAPAPSPLSQALAALGLPTDLDELDRLEDEADDAEDDAELDAYSDDQDPPLPANTS